MMHRESRPAVLILEDERTVALDLQRTLGKLGYDAFAIAASVDGAIARARAYRPDLVLLDIHLNRSLNGTETAAMLRQHLSVPIVHLAAPSDQAMNERAEVTEPLGYLLEPVRHGELRSVVGIALRRKQAGEARGTGGPRRGPRSALEAQRHIFRDRLLANMSHELRTPLNGLLGFAELLHDGMAGPLTEKQRQFLSHVLTSGHRFLQVINDVLELARLEAGKVEQHVRTVDLAALVAEVVGALRPALAAKAHRLAVEVDPRCARVVNDPALLKQIVYHFLSNAIKFTPPLGAVTLRATPQGAGKLRIAVTDSGIGIGAEDIGRLFTPFEQLDSGPGKSAEGAGIGLAITKRIAEAQGGSVGVDSTPGKGSVFFAELPCRRLGLSPRKPQRGAAHPP